MKKQNLSVYAFVAILSATAVACNPLSNMTKKAEQITYSVNPTPLEMHGDSVEVTISGTIPPKFFNKKVAVEITPTTTGESGDVAFKKLVLVGEDSEVEGQKIAFEKGGSFSYNDKVAYQDALENVTLNAVAVGTYKGKEKEFPARKIGSGTIITPKWVMDDDMVILGADKFTRVVKKESSATINYEVNKSNVLSKELVDADMKALSEWIKEMSKNPMFAFKGVDVLAYASPEGELSLNTNLADNRAASGASAAGSILSRNKVKTSGEFFNKMGKGEDWDGFKAAMQKTDIADKDLILRVLEMYPDKAKREAEIRNMAATFEVLQEKILPSLRRSEITVRGELTAYTDEQIKDFVNSAPEKLSAEEILYAATMTEDLDAKMTIYKTFAKLHAKDWRGPNNIGFILVKQNKMEAAKAEFDKANSLSPNNPVVNNNLGVYERANGNDDKAMEYYAAAKGAGTEVGNNMGYLEIKSGNYVEAVSNYGGTKSFNAALAQTLNKDYSTALQTIDASPSANTAAGSYLKAVIGARMKDQSLMVTNLKAAIAADASLKAKAKKDAEFVDYRENAEFQAAVN
ncbi:MAG: hypothetical protein HND54_03540 [Bacteroidetes bacterium]|nr:hypothetical protein [Flavobacteriales bacterium]NOG56793.1 hypothetical protein [Bacteroidota bacterium]